MTNTKKTTAKPPLKGKISDGHKEMMIREIAAWRGTPNELVQSLSDPESVERYNVPAVNVTWQTVTYHLKRIKPEDIAKVRGKFLKDFNDIPLAHKKKRVMELSSMYDEVTCVGALKTIYVKGVPEEVECSHSETIRIRRELLRDIKDELGENFETWQRKLFGDMEVDTVAVENMRIDNMRVGLARFGIEVVTPEPSSNGLKVITNSHKPSTNGHKP